MNNLTQKLIKIVEAKILPHYSKVGGILGVYIKGSLVDGYTEKSDLDITIVWHQDKLPLNREDCIKDISPDKQPLIINYQNVHMDRFLMSGQEFNIGHITVKDFSQTISLIKKGEGFHTQDIINPLILVSSFYYGKVIKDSTGKLMNLKESLNTFPPKLVENVDSYWEIKRDEYSQKLEKFLKRKDVISFSRTAVNALEVSLLTFYTKNKVYFPGYKWSKQHFDKHGLNDTDIIDEIEKMLLDKDLTSRYKHWIEVKRLVNNAASWET